MSFEEPPIMGTADPDFAQNYARNTFEKKEFAFRNNGKVHIDPAKDSVRDVFRKFGYSYPEMISMVACILAGFASYKFFEIGLKETIPSTRLSFTLAGAAGITLSLIAFVTLILNAKPTHVKAGAAGTFFECKFS